SMEVLEGGKLVTQDVPLRNAMNEVLRDSYTEDCQRAVDKWNKSLADAGISFRFELPSRRFHRHIGIYANMPFSAKGELLDQPAWDARRGEWLPNAGDIAYIASLQKACVEPGKLAHWVAPPIKGINGQPFAFEYVKRVA
ncbi:MAG: benzoyl-CoA 2,3-epoxidase subunit BoxB, partial [Acidobacteriota bacterium]